MAGSYNTRDGSERRKGALTLDGDPEKVDNDASVSGPSDPLTRDAVLAGCSKKNWTFDSDIFLPFGGKGSLSGAEQFRALRSRLYQLRERGRLNSLLVASARPGEGKSFVAANLAQAMALQAENRVLLIDGDLRDPSLHSALGTSRAPGFSDYLVQEGDEFAVMQRGDAANLFFIPSGRPIAGPTELIANGRLRSLLDRVEPLFDWIIIDSPAAMGVSDSSLLSNHCDGVLMVVRSGSTPFDVVRKEKSRFREGSLVGIVLNTILNRTTSPGRQYGEAISFPEPGGQQ